MGVKEKDKSLLEIAVELLQKKRKPQKILTIMTEVMEIKGYKPQQAKQHAAQFIADFMESGIFVYCGDDCWDLKERQSTAVLDKDGGDYEEIYYNDEDVKKNELKDDIFDDNYISDDDDDSDEDDDDDSDDDEEDDDIARELENMDDDDFEHEITEIESQEDDEIYDDDEDDLTEDDFK